jgi:hypothetical protein
MFIGIYSIDLSWFLGILDKRNKREHILTEKSRLDDRIFFARELPLHSLGIMDIAEHCLCQQL